MVPSVSKPPTINFVVHDPETLISGYTWRLWWHQRSFYVTPRWTPMSGVKVSFHGADDMHPTAGYMAGIDVNAMERAHAAGGSTNLGPRRLRFSGVEVEPGVLHVATFRWTFGLFRQGMPSGPNPDHLSPSARGFLIPPPLPGVPSDVYLFISQGKPFWGRNEALSRKDNACVGSELRNENDEYLTALSI